MGFIAEAFTPPVWSLKLKEEPMETKRVIVTEVEVAPVTTALSVASTGAFFLEHAMKVHEITINAGSRQPVKIFESILHHGPSIFFVVILYNNRMPSACP